ncbi:hypothetical protein Nepgr_010161 [Nepenthes gracilis]|uniref:C2 domain-containing protein n=1 Tax=Nepenthes gracilis TaxID=150966 RepID=A0AAD3SCF8_NEPGR|nr:hypothetical protein Nepgr_010161 [Nepenthes gracilis]
MEYRALELNVLSASNLKNVNLFSKMELYVVVYVDGGSAAKHKTPVDRDGDKVATWNYPINLTINELAAQQNRLTLVFHIHCRRALGDKLVGEVRVPVRDLLATSTGDGKPQSVSYQVRTPSGKPKGVLNFSYKFGDKVTQRDVPVTAYPLPRPTTTTTVRPAYGFAEQFPTPPPPPVEGDKYGGYPPAGAPVGWGHPAQSGYGSSPYVNEYGYGNEYGYPPVQQPMPKKNSFGMGLGAGLLGGALAGLLIEDLVSDAVDDDDDDDAGFVPDDTGGFSD